MNQAASLMKQVHKVEILPAHGQALPSLWGQLLTEGAKQNRIRKPRRRFAQRTLCEPGSGGVCCGLGLTDIGVPRDHLLCQALCPRGFCVVQFSPQMSKTDKENP